jgi:hypothetical protein
MVSVNPEERPGSANAVFEEICKNEFGFFDDVDPVKIRVELAKFGIVAKGEARVARVECGNAALKAEVEPLRNENAMLAARGGSLEAEIGRRESELMASKGKATRAQGESVTLMAEVQPMRQENAAFKADNAGLKAENAGHRGRNAAFEADNAQPKSRPAVAVAAFAGSMAQPYVNKLKEWLPWMLGTKLLQKKTGGDRASVDAFTEAANGHSKTITFVETENGCSICGGYLESAWVDSGWTDDPSRRSFISRCRIT